MPGFSFSDPQVWEAAENLQNDAPLEQTYVPQKKVQPKKPSRKERMSELELFNQLNNFKSAKPKKGQGKKQEGQGKKQEGQGKKQEGQGKKQEGQGKKQEGQSKKQEGQSKKQEGQSKKQEGQSKKQEAQSKKQEVQSKKQDGQSKKPDLGSKSKPSESKNAETRPKDSNATQKTGNQKQTQAPKILRASHYPGLIHLKWADFESHVVRLGYKQLRNKTSLVDVTLTCEGQTLKAHKKILSACSPLLKDRLKGADSNSVLNLKNTLYADVSAILEFMYAGEVYVEEPQLASVLRTAEKLQVKGMVTPNEE